MSILCRKLMEVRLYVGEDQGYQVDNDFGVYGKIIQQFLNVPRFRQAWLLSPYLFDDLEMFFCCHSLS